MLKSQTPCARRCPTRGSRWDIAPSKRIPAGPLKDPSNPDLVTDVSRFWLAEIAGRFGGSPNAIIYRTATRSWRGLVRLCPSRGRARFGRLAPICANLTICGRMPPPNPPMEIQIFAASLAICGPSSQPPPSPGAIYIARRANTRGVHVGDPRYARPATYMAGPQRPHRPHEARMVL